MGDEHIGAVVDRASGSVNAEEFTYRSAWIIGITIACVCVVTLSGCAVVTHLMDIERKPGVPKRICARHAHPAICKYSLQCNKLTRTEQEGGIS
jgi:hypothetical protein